MNEAAPNPRTDRATVGDVTVTVDKNEWLQQVAETLAQDESIPSMVNDQTGLIVDQYFRHADAEDMARLPVEDAAQLVASHFALAKDVPSDAAPAIAATESTTPTMGRVVIQLVIVDQPFLVDTVTMEVLRQGWSMVDIDHPQMIVRRDADGALQRVLPATAAYTDSSATRESWIHVEVNPPAGADVSEAKKALTSGLRDVIGEVDKAVADWPLMRERIGETVRLLEAMAQPVADRELTGITDFLQWLNRDHFTMLGYREYEVNGDDYTERPDTGLGILRDPDGPDAFHAVPSLYPGVLVITKDNVRSRIHRPAFLDHIAVRILDENGTPVAERRFLGLFAAAAYSDSVANIPLVRDKAKDIVRHSGFESGSHGSKAIWSAIETYPRDELFQSDDDALSHTVEQIARLKERRQVRLFVRADAAGRYLSCLVFLPRDRYTTKVRNAMEGILLEALGGDTIEYQTRVTESVLARLHFTVRMPWGEAAPPVDVPELEDRLTAVTQNWDDDLAAALEGESGDLHAVWASAAGISEGYKEDFDVRHALMDLQALSDLPEGDISLALYVPERATDSDVRLKVFTQDRMSLTAVLPHLANLGMTVVDERPYELTRPEGSTALIYDFGLAVPGGSAALKSWSGDDRNRLQEAFRASWKGLCEADSLNRLVMAAGLDWKQVSWLRAISRYLQQAGTPYSQEYIADCLVAHVPLVRRIVGLFTAKFDPDAHDSTDDREAVVEKYRQGVLSELDVVASLDHDRILRAFLAVIDAMVRTNAFRTDALALSFKLRPTELAMLPEPRPAFEVFVCSPDVEGVHLRFGSVARGGLRWSDRREDFRTEVLGLVKAQMVKNTVIVPVGAKGGFFPKQLPDRAADPQAWFAEGRRCYRVFINSLLDLSDNIIDGEIDPPTRVVRFDDDDAYLVVAADKGTATFSDVANEISVTRGFWLGDAFASGGSVGYDHKGMGITARGAWESVKRHFREMGVDCQSEDFTCVGIGDMAGDVFGNGMLLSKHTRLVAAFNHMHIFLDPNPDAAASWEERKRLFEKPRSTWEDYDASLISSGGGVYSRRDKSVPISPEVRERLGLGDDVDALAPNDLIKAILTAPVDLLWNGGIGTYVKATSETHAQVGDKSNDVLRVNGADLRCRAIGEGGNLGMTQLGRIEYAQGGGRVNTDFIDNSAGVDTSDHEVNIKILLAQEVAAGRLAEQERAELMASMTDEVAELVLANNYDQNLALANGLAQSASLAPVHERWMQFLENTGLLDRKLEFLPSSAEMEHRVNTGEGLTGPEMATLLAYTKIHLENELIESDLPDDPYFADRLARYFPPQLRERYLDIMPDHRLRREIITTVTTNRFVNSSGVTAYFRLRDELEADAADVIRAQLAARAIFRVGRHEEQTAALDNRIDAAVQTTMRLQFRNLVERGTRWVLANRRAPIDVAATVDELVDDVSTIKDNIGDLLVGRARERFDEMREKFLSAGVDEELANVVATAQVAYQSLGIVANAHELGADVTEVASVHFHLAEETGIDLLRRHIGDLDRGDRWATMARSAMREDLHALQSRLTAEAMAHGDADATPAQRVAAWAEHVPAIDVTKQTLAEVVSVPPDLARMSVGLRSLRALLEKP